MHVAIVILVLVLVLWRWLWLRQEHSKRRGELSDRSVGSISGDGSAPLLRQAIRQELIAWVVGGLWVPGIFAAYIFVM